MLDIEIRSSLFVNKHSESSLRWHVAARERTISVFLLSFALCVPSSGCFGPLARRRPARNRHPDINRRAMSSRRLSHCGPRQIDSEAFLVLQHQFSTSCGFSKDACTACCVSLRGFSGSDAVEIDSFRKPIPIPRGSVQHVLSIMHPARSIKRYTLPRGFRPQSNTSVV